MNEQKKTLLVELLNKTDPKKPYGTELFDALSRLTIGVAIEMVCLRWNAEFQEVEVYLVQRSSSNTAYPGKWHCPGSFMRPGEETKDVFTRIVQGIIGTELISTKFIADVNHPAEARGHVLSRVYLCELASVEGWHNCPGTWFLINRLPEKTVKSHRKRIIPAAVGAFVATDTSICT